MKKTIVCLIGAICYFGCDAQPCTVLGLWEVKSGRVARNYEMTRPYALNRVVFSSGIVELASGFFYNTRGPNEEYPRGRFPFVYYGNRERYREELDSVFIFSTPYKKWRGFRKICTENGLTLVGKGPDGIITLQRSLDQVSCDGDCDLRYVKISVEDGELSLFGNRFEAKYSNDNLLVYQGLDSLGHWITKEIVIEKRVFDQICLGFCRVDMSHIASFYPTTMSDFNTIRLEIGLRNGNVIKSVMQNLSCPDELRLALVPVLYGHQRYIHPNLTPK